MLPIFNRCEIVAGAVRPLLVVVLSPLLDDLTGVTRRREHALVQAFITQSAIEALDVCVLRGLAGFDEAGFDAPRVGHQLPKLSAHLATQGSASPALSCRNCPSASASTHLSHCPWAFQCRALGAGCAGRLWPVSTPQGTGSPGPGADLANPRMITLSGHPITG